jgi:NhaA family Na+:H+ antiporter
MTTPTRPPLRPPAAAGPAAIRPDDAERPGQEFQRTESLGGIVLLACTALALAWANSPWSDAYFALWARTFTIGLEGAALTKTVHHWINDGLMVLFFFLVGLEIKRELLVGELSSPKQAALPIAAAIGGMVVPAGIYVALNAGGPGAAGWGIPMATDIAFALGVLALLGPRVPLSLKVFLAAFAIVDDIGAVLVIAVFYTAQLSVGMLGAAAAVLVALVACNRAGVRHPAPYAVLGVLLWLAVLKSGIHATIAGVLLAMTIPARTMIDEDQFLARAGDALRDFGAASDPGAATVLSNKGQQEALHQLEGHMEQVQAPLLRMEHALHGLVAFGIMPLFAFSNAGVRVSGELFAAIAWPVALGVALGLVVGKVVGVGLATRLATRSGLAALPADVSWRMVGGASWLGGIGFTMSLFVADLAFDPGPLLDSAKLGILGASLVAGTVGYLLLGRATAGGE